ncbi:MAG: PAS domain-containing protein [Eubacteriales bacterium]|nr:PAS domain-containing protein [Eubacteriales bacterium]
MALRDLVPDFDSEKMKYVLAIKEAYENDELSLEEAQAKLRERVTHLKPYEIAIAEQELEEYSDDQCQKEDIQKMLQLYDGLYDCSRPPLPEDHPLSHYYDENAKLEEILKSIEDLVQYPVIKNQWYELYEELYEYRTHQVRKQNQLYPVLETKGFDRPSTTMWTLDDFVWDEIKEARQLLDEDEDAFIEKQAQLIADCRDLKQKEEQVLYPTSLVLIPEAEFEAMKAGDQEIGFAWIKVKYEQEDSSASAQAPAASVDLAQELAAVLARHGLGQQEEFDVAQGRLSLDQINLIYKHLPVDLSYVDENDIVRFYSDTKHRVFPRSRNVIGRKVQNCHPKKSVHIVQEIVEKFRSGEEDQAEFWINQEDLFIYIHYTAVRDENGKFRGVLEMMQDCTHIRKLTGSQTLLNWGHGNDGSDTKPENGSDEPAKPELQAEAQTDTVEKGASKLAALTSETRLQDLIGHYPQLKKDLAKINPAFKMLQTPLARIMIPKATIAMMSERSGMPVDKLIPALEDLIKTYEEK